MQIPSDAELSELAVAGGLIFVGMCQTQGGVDLSREPCILIARRLAAGLDAAIVEAKQFSGLTAIAFVHLKTEQIMVALQSSDRSQYAKQISSLNQYLDLAMTDAVNSSQNSMPTGITGDKVFIALQKVTKYCPQIVGPDLSPTPDHYLSPHAASGVLKPSAVRVKPIAKIQGPLKRVELSAKKEHRSAVLHVFSSKADGVVIRVNSSLYAANQRELHEAFLTQSPVEIEYDRYVQRLGGKPAPAEAVSFMFTQVTASNSTGLVRATRGTKKQPVLNF